MGYPIGHPYASPDFHLTSFLTSIATLFSPFTKFSTRTWLFVNMRRILFSSTSISHLYPLLKYFSNRARPTPPLVEVLPIHDRQKRLDNLCLQVSYLTIIAMVPNTAVQRLEIFPSSGHYQFG